MTIQIARSEIARNSPVPWGQLDQFQRRMLVSAILRQRGDDNSARFAFQIETSNPNFDFVVLDNK